MNLILRFSTVFDFGYCVSSLTAIRRGTVNILLLEMKTTNDCVNQMIMIAFGVREPEIELNPQFMMTQSKTTLKKMSNNIGITKLVCS